jgi:putative restriction endonuclease
VLDLARELAVREAACAYVRALADRNAGVVTRAELEAFTFEGQQLKLIDQSRGIRNPRELVATLTILSSPAGPYEDEVSAEGLRYAYRSGPVDSGDNRKLRRAAELGLPVILLRGIRSGVFVPTAPAFLTADHPEARCVSVALDRTVALLAHGSLSTAERAYAERLNRQRLHQPVFRAQVLFAYETTCAMCRLRHADLLDAAHIVGDAKDGGDPVVPNGLALCKIHHAAYDRNIVGIRPDAVVEVRDDILAEVDGPMLRYGLQALQGERLHVPRARDEKPDPLRLEIRYAEFRTAS